MCVRNIWVRYFLCSYAKHLTIPNRICRTRMMNCFFELLGSMSLLTAFYVIKASRWRHFNIRVAAFYIQTNSVCYMFCYSYFSYKLIFYSFPFSSLYQLGLFLCNTNKMYTKQKVHYVYIIENIIIRIIERINGVVF